MTMNSVMVVLAAVVLGSIGGVVWAYCEFRRQIEKLDAEREREVQAMREQRRRLEL